MTPQHSTVLIDGDEVDVWDVLTEGEWPVLAAKYLNGPKEYNGHLHGTMLGGQWNVCMPNVVESFAQYGEADCTPASVLHGPYFYAIWCP